MEQRDKHSPRLFGRGTRRAVAAALLLVIGLFFLPLLIPRGEPLYAPGDPDSSAAPSDSSAQPLPTSGAKDRGRAVRLQTGDGQVVELAMADYLWGVVAAEMPASFEEEALKAQACAARTYTVVCQNSGSGKHPGADICADSTCCQAYIEKSAAEARWGLNAGEYSDKIQRAVEGTDGLGILYDGAPIQALFFSSAAGRTVDAVEVWGNSVDYLKSVDSPEGEEVPNYYSTVTLTREEVEKKVKEAYPDADLSGDPAGWLSGMTLTASGRVGSMKVGGVELSGGAVRTLFGLRSACFQVTYQENQFTFSVTGYGHGVGMSQYGANAMAAQGSSWEDILKHYYTGVEIEMKSEK